MQADGRAPQEWAPNFQPESLEHHSEYWMSWDRRTGLYKRGVCAHLAKGTIQNPLLRKFTVCMVLNKPLKLHFLQPGSQALFFLYPVISWSYQRKAQTALNWQAIMLKWSVPRNALAIDTPPTLMRRESLSRLSYSFFMFPAWTRRSCAIPAHMYTRDVAKAYLQTSPSQRLVHELPPS